MSDLISRQAAIEAMKDMYKAAKKWRIEASDEIIKARAESCMATLLEIKLRVDKIPSAEPEVIRCKDCRHSEPWYRKRRCFLWSETGIGVFEDGFCNYAERRTDG